MNTDEDMKYKLLSSEYIIRTPWLTARRDKVQLPNGKINDAYYCLEYPDWINVIAETTDGQLILEKQYRHALGIVSTEICGGVVEQGETPLHAAQRELREETGFGGGVWREFMVLSPNPSTSNNYCHTFLAKGVTKVSGQSLDEFENLSYFLKSKSEVLQMLKQGQFVQALMAAPLWKYFYEGL